MADSSIRTSDLAGDVAIPPELRPFRVNMIDLLRQPGAERVVDASVDPAALDLALAIGQAAPTDDVVVTARATSGTDDVEVQCRIEVPWQGECRRCLAPAHGITVVEVDERYRPSGSGHVAGARDEGDVIAVDGDQIDLVPTIRETIMIELPVAPLCSADCAGICPVCGVDRNVSTCDCDVDVRDERWAALDGLRLDD